MQYLVENAHFFHITWFFSGLLTLLPCTLVRCVRNVFHGLSHGILGFFWRFAIKSKKSEASMWILKISTNLGFMSYHTDSEKCDRTQQAMLKTVSNQLYLCPVEITLLSPFSWQKLCWLISSLDLQLECKSTLGFANSLSQGRKTQWRSLN